MTNISFSHETYNTLRNFIDNVRNHTLTRPLAIVGNNEDVKNEIVRYIHMSIGDTYLVYFNNCTPVDSAKIKEEMNNNILMTTTSLNEFADEIKRRVAVVTV